MDVAEGGDGLITSLVTLVFFALFGYAYCTRTKSDDDAVIENEPSTLKSKDVKILRKMAEELQREKERVAKMEEKLKRFDQDFPPLSSNVSKTPTKSDIADSNKKD